MKSHLFETGTKACGRVVWGTVRAVLHDIRKRLEGSTLEDAGLEIANLTTDVLPARLAERARSSGARIVGMSGDMISKMNNTRSTIEAQENSGARSQIKGMVRWPLVTEAFADEIGADDNLLDAGCGVAPAKSPGAQGRARTKRNPARLRSASERAL